MLDIFMQLGLFTAKALIIVLAVLAILVTFFALLNKGKSKQNGKLVIKNLSKKYAEITEELLTETLPKKLFKQFLKDKKAAEKAKAKADIAPTNVYVLNFNGDIKASAVGQLSQEITALLSIATPKDEVVLRLESGGGVVHGYGLGAAQLMRLRAANIPLTIAIDKIAASGGYMMACIADKILAAPFAIIGSIGVIVQLPNFHRLLKENNIDFIQETAGQYKRTVTVFGENTNAGKEKLKEEIEDIHQHFKNLITDNRKQIDIQKVATGEHWLGQEALELKLVDDIKTSDDYILAKSKTSTVYELSYEVKKSFLSKLSASASLLRDKAMGLVI
jgi:serine protease SohB